MKNELIQKTLDNNVFLWDNEFLSTIVELLKDEVTEREIVDFILDSEDFLLTEGFKLSDTDEMEFALIIFRYDWVEQHRVDDTKTFFQNLPETNLLFHFYERGA